MGQLALTTVVARRFPKYRPRDWSRADNGETLTTDYYFSTSKTLAQDFDKTHAKMLALCTQGLQAELVFWQRALNSKSTTTAGLRAAIQRIRFLLKELGREDTLAASTALFHKQHYRRLALEEVREARAGRRTPEAITWALLQLRKGGWTPRDIGTTEQGLERLKKRLARHR